MGLSGWRAVDRQTPATPAPRDRINAARLRALLAWTAFAGGLALARGLTPEAGGVGSGVLFGAAVVFGAIALVVPRVFCRVCVMAAIALLGAGWWTMRFHEMPTHHIARLASDGLVTVEGTLLDSPRAIVRPRDGIDTFRRASPAYRFNIEVDTLVHDAGRDAATGQLWVVCANQPPDVGAGRRVRITGILRAPEAPLNPGEQDLRLFARQQGFGGLLTLSGPPLVIPLDDQPAGLMGRTRAAIDALRQRARSVVLRGVGDDASPQARSLLLGLVLGEVDEGTRGVRDAFARTGLAHVLSISGFHLAVMALVALTVVRLGGDHGRLEPLVVGVLVLLYALIVPPASPIVRSAAMVLAILAGEAFGRRHDRLTLLLWIALALLVWKPLDLWAIGYQLSVGLTALLFWAGRDFHHRLFTPPIRTGLDVPLSPWHGLLSGVRSLFAASVLCSLVSAPIVMGHVGLLSPGGVLATLLVTPVIVLVLWVAYIALIAGMVIPGVADASAWLLELLADLAAILVRWIDTLPFSSLRVPPMPVAWVVCATACGLWWVRRGTRKDPVAWSLTLVTLGWFMLGVLYAQRLPPGVAARLDMLSVGDGTCHILRAGDEALLWDCAPSPPGGVLPPIVQNARALGVWRTPTVVITHPDFDHFGGLPEVLEPLGVRRVIVPQRFIDQARDEPRQAAAWLLGFLESRGVEVRAIARGETISLGRTTLEVLSPPDEAAWPLDNDHSIMARLATPAGDLLLTGDVQEHAIDEMARAHPGLAPRVLELPHHGSTLPRSIEFGVASRPRVVLQSTGPSRLDDSRWSPLHALGPAWYTSARHGWSWVEFHRDGRLRHGSMHP